MARRRGNGGLWWTLGGLALVGGVGYMVAQAQEEPTLEERLRALVRSLHTRVARVLGVREPPLIFDNRVHNAQSDGSAVRINARWLHAQVRRYCSTPECTAVIVTGVLGHELSHHDAGDAFLPLHERAEREWRADFHAGYALAALGHASSDMERFIADSPCCSPLYPRPHERALAVRGGFEHFRA